MDQVQIQTRGTGTFFTSIYVQEQYEAAQQQFLQGNYLNASAIVERLVLTPEGRRSTQIQELKRRIDPLL